MKLQWVVTAVVITVLAFGFFRSRNASAQDSLDGKTLAQLTKAGSDLKKPHNIDFFFYFPTQEQAEKAAPKLEALGLATKIALAAKRSTWVIHGNKTMVPSEAELERLTHCHGATLSGMTGQALGLPLVRDIFVSTIRNKGSSYLVGLKAQINSEALSNFGKPSFSP